jgi:hypothetical protein
MATPSRRRVKNYTALSGAAHAAQPANRVPLDAMDRAARRGQTANPVRSDDYGRKQGQPVIVEVEKPEAYDKPSRSRHTLTRALAIATSVFGLAILLVASTDMMTKGRGSLQ